jgi:hypothetical protein
MQKGSDGRLIIIPPRLNGLRIKRQSFRQFAEQYKWNCILGNNTEDDEDGIDVDKEDNATSSPTRAIKSANITLLMSR